MRFSRPRRPLRALAILILVGLVSATGRGLWANGVFSSVTPGFSGQCKVAATLPVQDIEIANGVAYLSVADAGGPKASDGIYVLPLAGGAAKKLAGAPKDFHPRGIGLWRTYDGKGLFLFAVNRHGSGRFSIDSFEVADAATAPRLAPQGMIEGGLLKNPQDVAASGPGTFYVANGTAGKNPVLQPLQHYGVLSAGDILYFNGMSFREVADGLYGTRSLVMTKNGSHVIVGGLLGRSVTSFTRESLTGNLTEDTVKVLNAGPERLALDGQGQLWVAGHANLMSWRAMSTEPGTKASSQVLRVAMTDGVPGDGGQVYGNAGDQIAGAGAVAVEGNRLLIGSTLDRKLLDCSGG
jgi:arylesterase/paraoxonase